MRHLLTAAVIAAALFFSVGGVAIVSRAGEADAAQGQCPAPVRQVPIAGSKFKPSDEVIVLNTRGYNYAGSMPGDLEMDAVRKLQEMQKHLPAPAPAPTTPAR